MAEQPAQHFRTSVHSGPAFAHAVLALLRQHDLNAAIGAPGQRAEVGLSRDDWWADACAQLHDGVALAVDYGHLGDNRPARLSTVSYRHGRQSAACFDGHHDVTAHVAVDSLAARVGAGTRRQRSALLDLGVTGARPPLQQATTEPAAYLRALALASKEGELVATPGLGDFWWVTSTAQP